MSGFLLRSRYSFEQQLAFLVGLLCVALIGTVVSGAIWIGRRDAVRLISNDMGELAANMLGTLESNMHDRSREVSLTAGLSPLRGAWTSDPAPVREALNQLQATLPSYAWIGFAAPDGTVRAATGALLEGKSVAARPWFINGVKGPTFEDVHEAKLLAPLLGQKPDEEPFRFVDVAIPVHDEAGAQVGVVGAHLSWSWADDIRNRLLQNNGAGAETSIWVLGRDGSVLLGPGIGTKPFDVARLIEMTSKREGAFEDTSGAESVLTGFAISKGYKSFPGFGWTVVARRPTSVAYASVNDTVAAITMLGSAAAAVAIALAWILGRQSTAPLRQLTSAARQIGRDPSITKLPRLEGSREIAELSTALRSLLRRVGAAEQSQHDVQEQSALKTLMLEEEITTLHRAASTDPLTGLLNRRAFRTLAEDAMTYHRRYRRPIAILMADIDHFKRVNDTFGHAAGDAVIKTIGGVIVSAVRTTDKVARFGGEEFVVLLREIEPDAALLLAERMRQQVEAMVVRHGEEDVRVTLSLGVALVDDCDRDVEALIERADAALYEAKRRGRNRARIASSIELDRAA